MRRTGRRKISRRHAGIINRAPRQPHLTSMSSLLSRSRRAVLTSAGGSFAEWLLRIKGGEKWSAEGKVRDCRGGCRGK